MDFKNIYTGLVRIIIILFSITVIKCSFCQDDSVDSPVTLNGHKFIINSSIGSPFINTYYNTMLGAGQTTDLKLPEIKINGKPIAQLTGNLAYSNLLFAYQQEIRDWMAFYGEVKLLGRLGTEAGALITQGVNLATGYNMGWKFKLYQNKIMSLSADLKISKDNYTVADLADFIQNIIDSGGITNDNKLIKDISLVRGGIGFNYVYAFNSIFGAVAKLYVDYGESANREENDVFNYSYGFGIDADLYPRYNVPLGFLAGFYHTSIPQVKESPSKEPNEVIFQINYTGKKYLNLGAELNYRWYKQKDNDSYINFITLNLISTLFF